MPKTTFSAAIVKRRNVTDELFCLWLDLGKNREKFNFKPGQYCTIGLVDSNQNFICDDKGRDLVRPYSIVSSPNEEFIELFIELFPYPYGKLTPLLYELSVNDSVEVFPRAKGIFTFKPHHRNHVMVATVTGIAPFISMIREYSCSGRGDHRFFVLQGASYHDEFTYDEELQKIMSSESENIFLQYVPTISRPNEPKNFHCSLGMERGRVNTLVKKYLSLWELSKEDTLIYLCGHPGMIEDVKKRLRPKGWTVDEERYWKD